MFEEAIADMPRYTKLHFAKSTRWLVTILTAVLLQSCASPSGCRPGMHKVDIVVDHDNLGVGVDGPTVAASCQPKSKAKPPS